MQFIKISFIIILVVYTVLFLYFCRRNGDMIKTALLSAVSGLAVMTAVNLLSRFTGVNIAVNAWTVGSSAALGIPGVLGLLAMRLFF